MSPVIDLVAHFLYSIKVTRTFVQGAGFGPGLKRVVRKVRPKMLVLDFKRENKFDSRVGRKPQPARTSSGPAEAKRSASTIKTRDEKKLTTKSTKIKKII